jgi:hypothetical protein
VAPTPAGRWSILVAALGDEPRSTSDLYDRVGYPALMRMGLIQYDAFRGALAALEREGEAQSAPAPDGSTLWRLPAPDPEPGAEEPGSTT